MGRRALDSSTAVYRSSGFVFRRVKLLKITMKIEMNYPSEFNISRRKSKILAKSALLLTKHLPKFGVSQYRFSELLSRLNVVIGINVPTK